MVQRPSFVVPSEVATGRLRSYPTSTFTAIDRITMIPLEFHQRSIRVEVEVGCFAKRIIIIRPSVGQGIFAVLWVPLSLAILTVQTKRLLESLFESRGESCSLRIFARRRDGKAIGSSNADPK